MGTFTISASGFSTLPAAAPTNWPSNLTWPGAVSPNGSKSWTVSDQDWVNVLVWSSNQNASTLPATPTIGQILIAFAQLFVDMVKGGVVTLFQQPQPPQPLPPSPPTFT